MIGSIRCFSRKSIASRQWLLSAHCIGTTSDTRTSQKETPVYLTSRNYSLSQPKNSLVAVGLGVAGLSVLAKYGVDAYTAFQLERKQNSENVAEKGDETDEAKVNATAQDSSEKASAETKSKKSAPEEATNPFSKFFSMFGKNYYEGGFEDKMTKREAALILGVRESASVERIKDCHRRILLNNHPDRGGSAYLATKVNEAKDLLMKTKSSN